MRGGGWCLDGDLRDDGDCDNLCEGVSGLEAHTRLQESNWELSEHQSGDGYDDGLVSPLGCVRPAKREWL